VERRTRENHAEDVREKLWLSTFYVVLWIHRVLLKVAPPSTIK